MKKVAVLVQSKDAGISLERLRKLGLIHVEHQQLPQGKDISALGEDLTLLDQALIVLSGEDSKTALPPQEKNALADWQPLARHIIDLQHRLYQLKEYSLTLNSRIAQWQAWGDFDPQTVLSLRQKGIYLQFYQIPVKSIEQISAQAAIKVVSKTGGIANCLTVSKTAIKLPFKELKLPSYGLSQMKIKLAQDRQTMGVISGEIAKNRRYWRYLLGISTFLHQELEFQRALAGLGQSGSLAYLVGYIPGDSAALIKDSARENSWGLLINDPSPQDQVPTLIRNPRWLRIIKPLFKLLEIIPGYRELDISFWFLIFFSIFFGMLIGDAGIGLIFLAITLLVQRKLGRRLKNQSSFILFYILSCCAVLWGALTGTFFGQAWLNPLVKPLIPALRNDHNMQALCFLLGAIHLSIAHSWRAIIKFPALKSLAEIGWILILWAAFFLAKLLVLSDPFPGSGKWLLISGVSLVVIFTNPQKNLLKGLAAGLGSLLLNLINNFTDIVSYIRLFAVGLATVAVADSFNAMAMQIGFTGIIQGLVTALILIVGHSLNVILAPMSILVHAVRLNVLEFCTHLDIQWSGFKYKPLQEKTTSS